MPKTSIDSKVNHDFYSHSQNTHKNKAYEHHYKPHEGTLGEWH